MKIILILFLILTSVSYSQDTTFTDKPIAVIEQTYHSNGKMKIQKTFTHVDRSELESYREYYDNGQLAVVAKFKDSKLHGFLNAYWKNGNLKRKDVYNNGILIEGKCLDENGNELECPEFEVTAQMRK